MLFTKFVALALATLVAAEPVETEDNVLQARDVEVDGNVFETRDVEVDGNVFEARGVEAEDNVLEARAPFLGILYSRPHFRGASRQIRDWEGGRCINLHRPL
ncbi:hypothetical protein CDD83_5565 [Cordyceps sp. RAO-2017]|nr:hypothetical protein CDD83_5565 [Cordyceps sp. RAO-2017]